jgi:hypothetical protein
LGARYDAVDITKGTGDTVSGDRVHFLVVHGARNLNCLMG